MASSRYCLVLLVAAFMVLGCKPSSRPTTDITSTVTHGENAAPTAQPAVGTFDSVDDIPIDGAPFPEAELNVEPFDGLTSQIIEIDGKDAQIVRTSKNHVNPVGRLERRDGTAISDRNLLGPVVHVPWNAVLVREGRKAIAIDLDTGEERAFEVQSELVSRFVPAGEVVWLVSRTHYARVAWPPPAVVELKKPLPFDVQEVAGIDDGTLELYQYEGPDMTPAATWFIDENLDPTRSDRSPMPHSMVRKVADDRALLRGLKVERTSFSNRDYKIDRREDWVFVAGLNVAKSGSGYVFDALPARDDFPSTRSLDGRTMGPVHIIDTRSGEVTRVQPDDCPFIANASFALSRGEPFVAMTCTQEEGVLRIPLTTRVWAPGYEASEDLGRWFGAVSWNERASKFYLRDLRRTVSGRDYVAVGPNLLMNRETNDLHLLTDGQSKRRVIARLKCTDDSELGEFRVQEDVLFALCGVRSSQDHGDYRSTTTELRRAWIVDLREERTWKTGYRPRSVEHDRVLLADSPTYRSHGGSARITLQAARNPTRGASAP